MKEITTAPDDERLATFLRFIDPNQKYPLNSQQLQQLAKSLQQFAQPDSDLQQISAGLNRGLAAWQRLQDSLVSWMYEQNQGLGFGGVPGESGPWATWAKQITSQVPHALLRTLAMEHSAIEFAAQQRSITLSDWVEMALILQYLQRGLVNWFDQLRDTLDYLDEPLRRVEGTQEKARILTILGYSQRALGQYERSINFHQQALEIARNAGDRPCEIANLNHLSRTYVQEQDYVEAINNSQRALILSRQVGDRPGEANALINLGYSEVMHAQELEQLEPETYEMAINYLQQGLKLSEQLGDIQSKALCFSSLGIAYLVIGQPQEAIKYLEEGFKTAQVSGDLYLQGRNLAYLAEAYHHLQNSEKAIYTGSLGMYLLEQIASREWRQPAGLLTILQGQIGQEAFQNFLQQHRSKIIAIIGVDGYDHIPQLLATYQGDM